MAEDAAQTLDDLARVYEQNGRANAYADLAREIRAHLGSDKDGWLTRD